MATREEIERIYNRKLSPQEEVMRRIGDQEEKRIAKVPKQRIIRNLVSSERVQGPGPFQDNI